MRKSQNHYFGLPTADLEHILVHAQADLAALRGKKLFITGGTGFFGKWTLGGLLFADDELGLGLNITTLSRDPAAFLGRHGELDAFPTLKFVGGNVADFRFTDFRPDYLLHAATDATAFTTEAEERERSRTILDGTRRVLDFMSASGAQRLLNISSGAVYGAAAGKPTGAKEEEAIPTAPVTPYGQSKLEAEKICEQSGVDFVTARAFAFLGPYLPLNAHFAAGNFLRDALRGGPILVRGDGTAIRSYLHPADLIVWLLRFLVQGQRARAYNVGSDEAVTTAQLARLIAEAVSPQAEVVIQSLQPQGPQNIYLPNIDRAREELNLGVAIPSCESIRRTLTFHSRI